MAKDTIIQEGFHYKLVLLDEEVRIANDCNYAIVNKQYETIEAMCSALFMGYQLLQELDENLDEARPRASLTTVQ